MRGALYIAGVTMIVVMAFWAYRMNYQTQERVGVVENLRKEIGREREAIAVLRAEWAFLNAPERLTKLAHLHRGSLNLSPMAPEMFADLTEISAPEPDDGMQPITIIDLDAIAPPLAMSPPPKPRPAFLERKR
jgi:hypothetical protein